MGKGKTRRTRRHRRENKAVLRNGSSAKPRHNSPSGRTGSIRAKQLRERATRS